MTTRPVVKRELKDLTVAEWEQLIDEEMAYQEKIKGRTYPIGLNAKDMRGGIRTPYVTADFIRQFAYCIGDTNPLWSDPSYARKTRWGSVIAPPECEDESGFKNREKIEKILIIEGGHENSTSVLSNNDTIDHLVSLEDYSELEFKKSKINIAIYHIGWLSSLFSIILSFGFFIDVFSGYAQAENFVLCRPLNGKGQMRLSLRSLLE